MAINSNLFVDSGILPIDTTISGSGVYRAISDNTNGYWNNVQIDGSASIESLGDLLALEKITSSQYFQMKSMVRSTDSETRNMVEKIIHTKLQSNLDEIK